LIPKQLKHIEISFETKTFPVVLVCDRIYFQENIGSLFRISEAFGVEKIIFVGKDIPLNFRKINKTSRSTHLNVPYEVIEQTEQLLDFLTNSDYEIISLEITDSSKPIKEIVIPVSKKIALIIGNETNGISDGLLAVSNQIVHITMYGKNSSMNVVQATSIALYQITTNK
jgi:tRNA G18 (ribose-2'-O)-methylase SpoU